MHPLRVTNAPRLAVVDEVLVVVDVDIDWLPATTVAASAMVSATGTHKPQTTSNTAATCIALALAAPPLNDILQPKNACIFRHFISHNTRQTSGTAAGRASLLCTQSVIHSKPGSMLSLHYAITANRRGDQHTSHPFLADTALNMCGRQSGCVPSCVNSRSISVTVMAPCEICYMR